MRASSLRSALHTLALFVAAAAPVGAAAPALASPPEDPLAALERRQQEIFERIGPSVVFISTGGTLGSGFFAGERGLVLTSAHVVGAAGVERQVDDRALGTQHPERRALPGFQRAVAHQSVRMNGFYLFQLLRSAA